jgi:hypothetical protein
MNTLTYAPTHHHTNQNNQERLFPTFDFPEVELSDCESIAMSLELENIHSYQIGNFEKTEKFTTTKMNPAKEELDNSFNSCVGNCEENSEDNFYEQLAQLSEFQRNLIDESETKKSLLTTQKKIQKKKKTKKRRKKRSKKQLKKMLMKKSSSKIMEAFAMECDEIFSLYPTLTNKRNNTLSNFPQIFVESENFKQKSKGFNNDQKAFNSDSQSTNASDDEYSFSNVKSTLVKSKVSNLRASMLCFEMMSNLKVMTELSKCAKLQKRESFEIRRRMF